MFDKDILDNLKGQEIKELIVAKKIKLEELDTSALEKLLDYETDMLCLDMGDMELIHACAARLDELNGPVMTDEEFWSIIKKAEERMISGEKENTPVDAPVNAPARVVKKRRIWKKVWLVAAIVALLISAATMTASAFGFNIFEYFKEVMDLSVGGKVDKGTVTLINRGEAKEYDSMEELLIEENMDILYPSVLPESIRVTTIKTNSDPSGEDLIQVYTNDNSIYFAVYTNRSSTDSSFKGCEKHNYNGFTFYVRKDINSAYCYYNNCYYSISANNYENLLLIIRNFKEK
ncbi:MAG: hypothetical protein IKT37_09330 [Clostridia bacterium]|nr:hypothetical protein [Clostridia bacterium]